MISFEPIGYHWYMINEQVETQIIHPTKGSTLSSRSHSPLKNDRDLPSLFSSTQQPPFLPYQLAVESLII